MLDTLKKLPVIITIITSVVGGVISAFSFHEMIMEEINEDRKKFLLNDGRPLIMKAINHAADSILQKKKVSSRKELSQIINVEQKNVWKEIGELYNSEKDQVKIGLYFDRSKNQVYYIHTDGKKYRAFKDSINYYFFNHNNIQEWCK